MIKIPIEGILEPYIPPGVVVTLHVPNGKSRSEKHLVHQGGQMYEHIAYELRYGNLSSIKHDSVTP